MVKTMTEKKFYTHEDLLVAMSKLLDKEAINIMENMKISTILNFLNCGNETDREQLKNNFSESLHKELDIYNGFNKLYEMLPAIEHKVYTDEGVVQEKENVSSESTCDNQTDVVE